MSAVGQPRSFGGRGPTLPGLPNPPAVPHLPQHPSNFGGANFGGGGFPPPPPSAPVVAEFGGGGGNCHGHKHGFGCSNGAGGASGFGSSAHGASAQPHGSAGVRLRSGTVSPRGNVSPRGVSPRGRSHHSLGGLAASPRNGVSPRDGVSPRSIGPRQLGVSPRGNVSSGRGAAAAAAAAAASASAAMIGGGRPTMPTLPGATDGCSGSSDVASPPPFGCHGPSHGNGFGGIPNGGAAHMPAAVGLASCGASVAHGTFSAPTTEPPGDGIGCVCVGGCAGESGTVCDDSDAAGGSGTNDFSYRTRNKIEEKTVDEPELAPRGDMDFGDDGALLQWETFRLPKPDRLSQGLLGTICCTAIFMIFGFSALSEYLESRAETVARECTVRSSRVELMPADQRSPDHSNRFKPILDVQVEDEAMVRPATRFGPESGYGLSTRAECQRYLERFPVGYVVACYQFENGAVKLDASSERGAAYPVSICFLSFSGILFCISAFLTVRKVAPLVVCSGLEGKDGERDELVSDVSRGMVAEQQQQAQVCGPGGGPANLTHACFGPQSAQAPPSFPSPAAHISAPPGISAPAASSSSTNPGPPPFPSGMSGPPPFPSTIPIVKAAVPESRSSLPSTAPSVATGP